MPTYILGAIAVLALVVAAILIVASRRPDTFRVVRSTVIETPPEKIFPLIADFHRWIDWSPYEGRDPNLKRDFAGTAGSVGHSYAWDGNKNVGAGRMTLAEVAAPQRISLKLDFMRPFKANNIVVFGLQPQAGGTEVSWDMHGPTPLLGKVMHMFMDMDKLCGDDFAKGLASLKALAERG
jgi:uncharacterized protein YndB with AHSA1/START domain